MGKALLGEKGAISLAFLPQEEGGGWVGGWVREEVYSQQQRGWLTCKVGGWVGGWVGGPSYLPVWVKHCFASKAR